MHLSVSYHNTRFGSHCRHLLGGALNVFNLIVKVEDLPPAAEFSVNGFCYHALVVINDVRLHRVSVLWWFFKRRNIAQSAHSHIECAGNRRCGKGQNINRGIFFLEAFLLSHTEPLFLVDDRKSQIIEFYAFLNELVSTDDQVDISALESAAFLTISGFTSITFLSLPVLFSSVSLRLSPSSLDERPLPRDSSKALCLALLLFRMSSSSRA